MPRVMMPPDDITGLLAEVERSNSTAAEQLAPLVYSHLRQLAASHFRNERRGHSLNPTILVHDAFLRLVNGKPTTFNNRAHFFSLASRVMRQILIDHARRKRSIKRGAGIRAAFDEAIEYSDERSQQFVALDDALLRLEKLDARQARIVEMRYFGGMTVEETAVALKIKPTTVKLDWKLAKAWLKKELEE